MAFINLAVFIMGLNCVPTLVTKIMAPEQIFHILFETMNRPICYTSYYVKFLFTSIGILMEIQMEKLVSI